MTRACVLGDVDLVRALALAGIESDVMPIPGDPSPWSRSTRRTLERIDHWGRREEFVARLLDYARGEPEPPVLYFQTDGDVLAVSRHRDELAGAFRFVLAGAELIEDLLDKARAQALATRLDLPIPPARLASPEAGEPPADLDYPLVAKPLFRVGLEALGIGGKAARVESAAELERMWPALAGAGGDVLLQKLIPGPESRVESYHAYLDEHGVVAEFTGRKIRTDPPEYGFTTATVTTDAGDVERAGRDVLERVGLTGVAKVDFKRDDDGRLWLLEINPRFNLWHHLGAVAGVNIPAFVHADLTGSPRPERRRARAGVSWCLPLADARAARAAGVPLGAWLRWAARAEAKSGFAWGDPMPLLRGVAAPPLKRRAARLIPGRG